MRIKGFILALLICLSFGLFGSAQAHAFSPLTPACTADNNSSSVCKDANNTNDPITGKDGIITKAVQIFVIIIGITAVIVIVIGGFQFVTSGGNPDKVATARRMIIYAAVGLIVAALAQLIVIFVLSKL